MARKRLDSDRAFQLIMECRSSGLSDRQWCLDQGIPLSTFYAWLKKLRNQACCEIPESSIRNDNRSSLPSPQDVVQVKIIPDSTPVINSVPAKTSDETNIEESSITIHMAGIQVGIKNSADPHLLADTLKILRMFIC